MFATFSSSMYVDNFKLVVPLRDSGKSDFWDSVSYIPWMPFDLNLWLMIIGVFSFTGILLTVEEMDAKARPGLYEFATTKLFDGAAKASSVTCAAYACMHPRRHALKER